MRQSKVPIVIILAVALLIAGPVFADGELTERDRAEVLLELKKRRTAERADRLTGSTVFSDAYKRRRLTKPRRYIRERLPVEIRRELRLQKSRKRRNREAD